MFCTPITTFGQKIVWPQYFSPIAGNAPDGHNNAVIAVVTSYSNQRSILLKLS